MLKFAGVTMISTTLVITIVVVVALIRIFTKNKK